MKYDVVSHAKKVSILGESICQTEHQLGKKGFAASYRNGAEHQKFLLERIDDNQLPKLNEADRPRFGCLSRCAKVYREQKPVSKRRSNALFDTNG